MFIYLKIALKGFLKFRKKRKHLTLVLIGAFFLSFFLMNFFNTVFTNIHSYWGKMLLGEYTLVHNNYKDFKFFKPPRKEYFYSFKDIQPVLTEFSDIQYSKRLRFFSIVEGYHSEKRQMVVLIGAESEKEQKILTNLKLMEGRWPKEGKKEIGLFLSTAGVLKTEIGDSVVIYTQNNEGYMDYDLLKISGIIEPKEVQSLYGSSIVGFVPYSFARSIKNVKDDEITEVILSNVNGIDKILLNYSIPDQYKIINLWNSEDIPLTMYWICMFLYIVLLVVISIIVFSVIYHNLHLMILERYKEIGVFLSFGASKRWLSGIWISELFIYALYCSLYGVICSILLIYGFNALEINAVSAEMELFLSASQFIITIEPLYYFYSVTLLFLIILAGAAYPLYKGLNEHVVVKLFRK